MFEDGNQNELRNVTSWLARIEHKVIDAIVRNTVENGVFQIVQIILLALILWRVW
jgi:hypothetical protein